MAGARAAGPADFARLARGILRQRFLRAGAYQLPLAYVAAAAGNVSVRHGLASVAYALVSPATLAHTAAAYVAGVAALAVHARMYSVTRTAHGSHFPGLQRLLRRPAGTGAAVGVYAAAAVFQLAVHGRAFGGGAARMWLHPEGHYGPPQLNPAWLASWLFALAVGARYAAQLVADERLQLAFPAVEQGRVHALKDRLPRAFSYAAGFAGGVLAQFWVAYLVFGWGVYHAVCGALARVFSTSSYAVGSPLFSVAVLLFWLRSGTLMVLTWELAHQLFEVVVTEPTHINELSLDRNLCLANGLKCADDPLIQHLAYQELYRLTAFSPEQRAEILADIDRASGTMWAEMSGQCLAVISAATEQLRAHAPAPPKGAASGAAASAAAAGGGRKGPDQGVSLKAGGAPMRDILLQSRKTAAATGPRSSVVAKPLPPPGAGASELFVVESQGLEKYVLTAVRDVLLRSAVGQRIMSRSQRARSISTFANFQQQVWAVRSLVRLVECSVREDQYGVVQGDIGAVLDVLFAYLVELEACAARDAHTGGGQATAMIQVLRTSLYAFTTTFYEHLEALRLPPAQARQLQRFADFRA
ncbi:hypothetical protein H4R18_001311 [Coemansia javaensis]|uniref:Nucleoporin NDC1 n=1 Tax=Coemansia javaensis TaxID=2761396 RepID=A0A9W8HKZ4_9FUNG|nr:hypothetical protein H4R18_001311 [Coemansia javaensis]